MMNSSVRREITDITVAAVNNPDFLKGLDSEEQIKLINDLLKSLYTTMMEKE